MNMKKNTLVEFINNPRELLPALLIKTSWMFRNDEQYLKLLYRLSVGHKLNLEKPETYCEKLQWLKLYNKHDVYTRMVDKVTVKDWVSEKIGSEYIIPTIAVYNNTDEIDFEKLPNQFVLKCNHNSKVGLCICKDKFSFNIQRAIKELKRGLSENHYMKTREWPYKNVPRRILAEKYMEEEGASFLHDYKVMCFNGEAKLIEYHAGRFSGGHTQDFYDTKWNKTTITQGHNGSPCDYIEKKPALLEEMIRLSEVLSADIPHVRVDWYIVKEHLYFGEMTFFDSAGFMPMDKKSDELLLGSWIKLPTMLKK